MHKRQFLKEYRETHLQHVLYTFVSKMACQHITLRPCRATVPPLNLSAASTAQLLAAVETAIASVLNRAFCRVA